MNFSNLLSAPKALRPMMAKQFLSASGFENPVAFRMADRLLGGEFGTPNVFFEENADGEGVTCTVRKGEEVLTVTLTYRRNPE